MKDFPFREIAFLFLILPHFSVLHSETGEKISVQQVATEKQDPEKIQYYVNRAVCFTGNDSNTVVLWAKRGQVEADQEAQKAGLTIPLLNFMNIVDKLLTRCPIGSTSYEVAVKSVVQKIEFEVSSPQRQKESAQSAGYRVADFQSKTPSIVLYKILEEDHHDFGDSLYRVSIAPIKNTVPKKEDILTLGEKIAKERTKSKNIKYDCVYFYLQGHSVDESAYALVSFDPSTNITIYSEEKSATPLPVKTTSKIASYHILNETHEGPQGVAHYDIAIVPESQGLPAKDEVENLAEKIISERARGEDRKQSFVRFWIPGQAPHSDSSAYAMVEWRDGTPVVTISELSGQRFLKR
jgi:hypothetical protein